jgi:glutathione S-transferase
VIDLARYIFHPHANLDLTAKESSMTELYVFPPSPRAFKVMAIANYLGIEPTLHVVDLIKGEQKSPHYTALNPNMRMPTLRDGDYVLWESNAILQYLAAKRPESGLLPADEKARLDVTRWQFWDLAHWDPACAVFIFENVVKSVVLKSGEPDAAALAKATESFHRLAQVLDGQLKGKKFVTGDTLTVADFSLAAPMNYAEMARFPAEPYSEIKRWYGTLRALPAWQKTLAQCTVPAAAAA